MSILVAFLNYYFAEKYGRDPLLWAIAGLVFSWPVLLLLLIIGETDEQKAKIAKKNRTKL